MWEFNVLVTMAHDGRYRQMLAELAPWGEFHKTEFHGVALGKVPDILHFLETIRAQRQERLIAFQDLSRIVPLDKVFTFDPDDFLAKACQAIRPYLPRMSEHRFYVRLERRGYKGQIVSPDVEQALDSFILDELADTGHSGKIDYEAADAVLVLETVGNRCGVGFITREFTERYPFVHVD